MIMTARYPGTCSVTGKRFPAGTRIDFNRFTKKARIIEAGQDPNEPDYDPAASAPHYRRELVSNVFRIGGREYYRNKRGLCEDAPACGCCTI